MSFADRRQASEMTRDRRGESKDEASVPSVIDEQRVWAKPDSLQFFQTHRQRTDDLYPSERFFLPDVLLQVTSCLDVGCAAGGFSRIMKTFNPSLKYTGLDVTQEFVDIARQCYPDSEFMYGDGIHFQTPPESYDLVFSSGLLHLNSHYRSIVRSCYAQARRFLLCDFRVTRGPSVAGTFRVEFAGHQGGPALLPYCVLNIEELLELLLSLRPVPHAIRARGYYRAPSELATVPVSQVLMAFFLIEKGEALGPPTISLDFPDTWA